MSDLTGWAKVRLRSHGGGLEGGRDCSGFSLDGIKGLGLVVTAREGVDNLHAGVIGLDRIWNCFSSVECRSQARGYGSLIQTTNLDTIRSAMLGQLSATLK